MKGKMILITPKYFETIIKSTGDKCIFWHIDGIPEDAELNATN